MCPNVVACSDDSVNHDSQTRAIFRHFAEERRQTCRAIGDERIVLNVPGHKEVANGFFGVFPVDHRVVQRENVVLVANGGGILGIHYFDHCQLLLLFDHVSMPTRLSSYDFKPTIWSRSSSCSASDFSWTNRRTCSASSPTGARLGAGLCSASSITRFAADSDSSPLLCILLSVLANVSKASPYRSRCSEFML